MNIEPYPPRGFEIITRYRSASFREKVNSNWTIVKPDCPKSISKSYDHWMPDLPTSDWAIVSEIWDWGKFWKFLLNQKLYKTGGNWGNWLTLSHSEAWFWIGPLLESHRVTQNEWQSDLPTLTHLEWDSLNSPYSHSSHSRLTHLPFFFCLNHLLQYSVHLARL